jgi:hypothetical protein
MGAITAEVVDTGEKRDGRGRRVLPRSQRLALIEAFRASGMSMAAFARRERINYTTFAGWMHRAGSMAPSSAIRFAEVPTIPAPSAKNGNELEVRLPDGTLLRGGRVADLIALVRALRS